MGEIKFIDDGKNNILLIAPHGRQEDDINTANITKILAKKLDCHAAINTKYRRPDEDKKEIADAKMLVADLNDKKSIGEANLTVEWLDKIENIKNIIVGSKKVKGTHNNCYIFLIHGAKDVNINAVHKKADILLGIGRVKEGSGKNDRPTATDENLQNLINCLRDEGSIIAVEAKAAKKDSGDIENRYAGHDINNLNQCFVQRPKGVFDPKVQSFQIEIKYTGFRNPDNIEKTATRLAAAIGKLTGIVFKQEEEPQAMKKEIVANTDKMVQGVAPEIIKAADKIIEIFQNNLASGLIEVGAMLMKEFFNDDFSSVRNREKLKDEPSILQIHRELESRGVKSVSKSWLYNAINVAADTKYIESRAEFFDFHTYGNLPASHKVLLERVKDDAQKQAFIVEAGAKNLSFVELKNTIGEKKKLPAPAQQVNVLKAANNPAKLFSGNYDSLLNLNALKAMRSSSRNKLKEEIASAIEKQEQYLEKYRKLVEELNAIPEEKKQKKDKKKVG
jgi:hypothetical protein